jgi:8-hydroxy-5-deazaflavin:NADPH oxidoreductase
VIRRPIRHTTIIGTGDMAHAIAKRVAKHPHTVTLFGRSEARAQELASRLVAEGVDEASVFTAAAGDPLTADVVVLAVPYSAVLGASRDARR